MDEKHCPACGGVLQFEQSLRLEVMELLKPCVPVELYSCSACGRYEFYKPQEVRSTDAEERSWLNEFDDKVAAGLIARAPFVCPSCGSMRRDKICPVCGFEMDLRTMTAVRE